MQKRLTFFLKLEISHNIFDIILFLAIQQEIVNPIYMSFCLHDIPLTNIMQSASLY